MTEMLRHTPYDGSRAPFSIGLAQLDLADWIEIDGRLARDLAEKDRLLAERRDVVFRAEPDTLAAQQEVLEALVAHLLARFPGRYRRDGEAIVVADDGRQVALAGDQPLVIASRLVQEDFLLMRRGEGGYRLVAGALCFPSAWSLAEKFGQTLDGLHERVPHYGERLAPRMNRIFDALKTELPVWRVNWSLYPDDALHHPESKDRPRDWFSSADALDARAFVRVERQTLRRMPLSGDILFTVRIHVDPVAAFRRHPEGPRLAAGLAAAIRSLDTPQLTYKALATDRDAVLTTLDALAAGWTAAG